MVINRCTGILSMKPPLRFKGHHLVVEPGEEMGQPGILTGDTRVSHTSLKGECGIHPGITSEYSWLSHI